MKFAALLKQLAIILLLAVLAIPACRKKDLSPPQDPVLPGVNGTVDTISNHLRFFKSTKKLGGMPRGPVNPSFKISFKDTLFLVDAVPRPIKFLHEKSANVAGVYLRVKSFKGSGASTHYYDVPEIKETTDSDTVSVIMIGIEPQGLEVPVDFDITITPYDNSGKPLAEATKPAKIAEPKNQPQPGGNGCGLILPSGERWEWSSSHILGDNNNGDFEFYNQPGKVFGAAGQNIEGSCCSGDSKWPLFCVGEKKHNKTLHFATYYKIDFETFRFSGNGTFFRQTMEDAPVALPDKSDFCGGGAGRVQESLKHSTYEGDWTISRVILPANLKHYADRDTLQLQMRATGGTGVGYGNPGGVIHHLDCELGLLTLIQLDREGGSKHLFKFYERKRPGEPLWYPFQ